MAAPYNPPRKNEDFLIRIALPDANDPRSFKSSPTIAAGDFKVDKDAGGLTNLATLPSVSPAASVLVLITLSATEMNADVVTLVGIDQTNPKEWADFVLCIQTTSDTTSEIADQVWNEARSDHETAGSFGQSLQIIRDGTAQGGAAGSITLDAGASASDDFYNGMLVSIIGGTGADQTRLIHDYIGTTKVASTVPAWITNPDATSVFVIHPAGMVSVESWERLTPNALTSGLVQTQANQLGAQAKTDVNTEVVDTLNTDTYAEPGQEAPPATTTLVKKIGYLYKAFRNKITQTSTTLSLFADDAATVDQKATVSDDATTYTRGEIGTGP